MGEFRTTVNIYCILYAELIVCAKYMKPFSCLFFAMWIFLQPNSVLWNEAPACEYFSCECLFHTCSSCPSPFTNFPRGIGNIHLSAIANGANTHFQTIQWVLILYHHTKLIPQYISSSHQSGSYYSVSVIIKRIPCLSWAVDSVEYELNEASDMWSMVSLEHLSNYLSLVAYNITN